MPEKPLERLVNLWSELPGARGCVASAEPGSDQHEQNTIFATSMLQEAINDNISPSTLFQYTNGLRLGPAWKRLLESLQGLLAKVSRAKRGETSEVDVFIFDPKTFQINQETGGTSHTPPASEQICFGWTYDQVLHARSLLNLGITPKEASEHVKNRKRLNAAAITLYMLCKDCKFLTNSENMFISHKWERHSNRETNNLELYACPTCDQPMPMPDRHDHLCKGKSIYVKPGTRDLFMVYWLKFMKLQVSMLKKTLNVWQELVFRYLEPEQQVGFASLPKSRDGNHSRTNTNRGKR
jgi:hypothetical protein